MPPKDSMKLDAGTIYFAEEGETLVPLGEGIREATFEPAEGGVVDPEIAFNATALKTLGTIELKAHIDFSRLSAELAALSRVWTEFIKEVKPILECKNRRLIHLANHGKPRVRKKNIKRIMRGD